MVISGITITKIPGGAGISHFGLGLVSCPPAGSCVAEGEEGDHMTIVMRVSQTGRPGRITRVPNANGSFGTACPRASFCLALAQADSPASSAVVIPVRSGIPGAPQFVADSYLASISCGSRSSCWAFGGDPRRATGRIVHIFSGRIVHRYTLRRGHSVGPGICVSASRCIALGGTYGGRAKVLTIDRGKVTKTSPWVAPSSFNPYLMACQTAAECVVVGNGIDQRTGQGLGGALATVTDGRVGPVRRDKAYAGFSSLTCSRTACFAFGGSGGHPVVVPVVNGSVGDPMRIRRWVYAQTCNPRRCLGAIGRTVAKFKYSIH
jgi:hypothetical protein